MYNSLIYFAMLFSFIMLLLVSFITIACYLWIRYVGTDDGFSKLLRILFMSISIMSFSSFIMLLTVIRELV